VTAVYYDDALEEVEAARGDDALAIIKSTEVMIVARPKYLMSRGDGVAAR